MKKLLRSFIIPLAVLTLTVVVAEPAPLQAQAVFCPVGMICTPIPSCPEGFTCIPNTPQPVNCPSGYTCKVVTTDPNGGGGGGSTNSCYSFSSNMTLGSTGADVVALQTILIAFGFNIPDIASGSVAKGYYGASTAAAVRAFQVSKGIPATGFAGPLTRAALNSACGSDTPSFRIISPNGGETYRVGDTVEIRWNRNTLSSTTVVKLELGYTHNDPTYGAGQYFEDWIVDVTANSGSYRWTIPEYYATGVNQTSFRIKISASSQTDYSDYAFTILPGVNQDIDITVSRPAGGNSYKMGDIVPVTWRRTTNQGYSVSLLRYNDPSFLRLSLDVTGTAPNLSWRVPSGLPIADDYFLKVNEGIYRNDTGYSAQFKISDASQPNSTRREQVRQLYLDLQHREPDQQGWDYWVNTGYDIAYMKQLMMQGIEYQTKTKIVQIFKECGKGVPGDLDYMKWYYVAEYNGYNTEVVRQGIGCTKGSPTPDPLSGITVSPVSHDARNDYGNPDDPRDDKGIFTITVDVTATGKDSFIELGTATRGTGENNTGANFLIQDQKNNYAATTTGSVALVTLTRVSGGTVEGDFVKISAGATARLRLTVDFDPDHLTGSEAYRVYLYSINSAATAVNATAEEILVPEANYRTGSILIDNGRTTPSTPVPQVSISVNPSNILVGQSATVSWSSSGAESCSFSGIRANTLSGNQEVSFSLPTTATYTISCKNKDGVSAKTSATLTVNSGTLSNPGELPTAIFTIEGKDSHTYNVGETNYYKWSAENADTFSSSYTSTGGNICGGGPWVANTKSGTSRTTISNAYAGCTWVVTYTATNSRTGQSASDTVTVKVNPLTPSASTTQAPTVWNALRALFPTIHTQ